MRAVKKKESGKRKKFELSESKLGYFMVAPAIIIILTVALYPVFKSFAYSLFDFRLNNPIRNGLHTNYKLNMENYFSNYDLEVYALKQAEITAADSDKAVINECEAKFENVNNIIVKQKDVASKIEQVKKYTDKFMTVTDNKIKYASLDKTQALSLRSTLSDIESALANIKSDKKSKPAVDKAIGIVTDIQDSVITPNFTGLENYAYYFGNKDFHNALGFTVFFTLISVSLELVLGLITAVIINRSFKGRGIVRAIVLIPWAIPTVVSALMWKFLYDGQNGYMAHIFASLNLISNSGVLLTTHVGSMFAIIFADVWKTVPYMALLLLAGLQGIDNELYEASSVDGASKLTQFFKITLPLLKPTILVALLFRTLDAFRIFDLPYVLTNGANGTESISTFAYKTMFSQMEFGRGSTLAVITFLCVAIISIIYIKLLGADLLSDNK